MTKLAVFASGQGSNLQALVEAIEAGRLEAEIVLVVCDRPGAYCLTRAKNAGIPTLVFNPRDYENKVDYELVIKNQLRALQAEYLVLAGYMRLIGSTLLDCYPNRIINIHPSLLPLFPGKDGIGQALDSDVQVTGVTIHYVDEGMDTGPVISQSVITLDEDETRESLEKKIHAVEHSLYPRVLQEVLKRRRSKMRRRALISVSNKDGLVEFAQQLVTSGFELISTGGTAQLLRETGLPVREVNEITGFPEILEGRVKTLHPKIHGGLLAKLDQANHLAQLEEYGITPIDLVCVNLYPFQATISRANVTLAEAIENIDIGGPTLLRAAAKNHDHVTVVVDPADYAQVGQQLEATGEVDSTLRRKLAAKVFRHTAAYDALIAGYLTDLVQEDFPEKLTITYNLEQSLRYGENPQQRAAFYRTPLDVPNSLIQAKQLQGKELSYNNINDANSALEIVREFVEPAAVAVKHSNPCGVGVGATIEEAFDKAFASDPVSIFGGIVALNRPVDEKTAEKLHQVFLEIILAPSFTKEALAILSTKKNLRLLTLPIEAGVEKGWQHVSIPGGLLTQARDSFTLEDAELKVVTKREPSAAEWEALKFGWRVVKHVKSNAIVVNNQEMTLGVGAGQMNRVGAAEIALRQAGDLAQGAVLASDAFFPMDDTLELAAKAGITAIIQPGGSIRDQDSIDKANEYGIAMVFTGVRHFKH